MQNKISIKILVIIAITVITILKKSYSDSYDSNIINLSFNGLDTIALIIKDQYLLNIVEITPDSSHNIKTFKLLALPNLDNKNMNKDEATPEGIYFINEIIKLKDFNTESHPTAAVLNYPNPVDIYNKRTGNNVWIQNQTHENTDNQSCFYLKNNNLDDLLSYIHPNSTPILILKSYIKNDGAELSNYWSDFIQKWQASFSSKMLISHFKMYITETDDIDFQYAKRINSILQQEKDHQFKINDLIILRTPEESIASFHFTFSSPNYSIDKPFSLSLLPLENDWKIISENSQYQPKPVKSVEKKLKEKIFKLIKDWEDKDFKSYIANFDDSFSDGKRNYRQFYNYKRRSFQSIKDIKVTIKDLEVRQLNSNQWLVSFIQDYWTENYQDYGRKEIIFQIKNDDYLIVKEFWEEIPRN